MTTRRGLRTVLLAASMAAMPWSGGAQDRGDDWCGRDQEWSSDRAEFCEVRELTMGSAGSLAVDASPNGGISVEGAARSDVHVRARVTATAATRARAREIAAAVRVQPSGDRIESDGPTGLGRRESWSVSYRIAVPRQMGLQLRTVNGGIAVRNVEGRIEVETSNGGVKLAGVAGDVRGRTTNGGVAVDLDGPAWHGEGLDVETSNGGVTIAIPDGYSARLEAGTVNGGLRSDFPATTTADGRRRRTFEATLGSGGATIRVRTSNGGVRITRK